MSIQPGPDRRAANRQLHYFRQRRPDSRHPVFELGDVARELLPERERHCVHQMGPANLDDIRDLRLLLAERCA